MGSKVQLELEHSQVQFVLREQRTQEEIRGRKIAKEQIEEPYRAWN